MYYIITKEQRDNAQDQVICLISGNITSEDSVQQIGRISCQPGVTEVDDQSVVVKVLKINRRFPHIAHSDDAADVKDAIFIGIMGNAGDHHMRQVIKYPYYYEY